MALSLPQALVVSFVLALEAFVAVSLRSAIAVGLMAIAAVVAGLAAIAVVSADAAIMGVALTLLLLALTLVLAWEVV